MSEQLRATLYDPVLGKIIALAVAFLLIIAIVRFVQRSLGRYVKDSDMRYRARKGISFLGYLAAAIVAATVLSDQLGGLTVALGVAGAGIAFALQEVIASLAGWFAVSFANFYRTGDRVQLGGIKGDVIDIGLLRTTLMECGDWVKGDLYNGRVVRVANSFVFKEPVYNYSGDFPFLWDEIVIPIKYGCSHVLAREVLLKAATDIVGEYAESTREAWADLTRKYLIEEARIDPAVTLAANDNWIEFTIRYVVDYRSRRITKDRLFTRILDDIDASGGRLAIASATFHLVEAPPIDVRVSHSAAAPASTQ